jgi:hypothetical protein
MLESLRWLQRDEGAARTRLHEQYIRSCHLTSPSNTEEFLKFAPKFPGQTGYTYIHTEVLWRISSTSTRAVMLPPPAHLPIFPSSRSVILFTGMLM